MLNFVASIVYTLTKDNYIAMYMLLHAYMHMDVALALQYRYSSYNLRVY